MNAAESWASAILDIYLAYQALEEGNEKVIVGGREYTHKIDMRDLAESMALGVEVRSPWHNPGDREGSKPDKYRILLSWGGHALRLVGSLDRWREPTGVPTLEIQDRGTPWEEYRPCPKELENMEDPPSMDDVLIWFSWCFWFGE